MSEPLVPFIRALQRVESDLSVDDAADILWLALQMSKTARRPAVASQPATARDPQRPLESPPPDDAAQPASPAAAALQSGGVPDVLSPAPPAGPASLYQPPASAAPAPGGLPLRTPAAPAVPGKRELLRALRPLVRRGASSHRQQLHLAATVQRIADEGLWLPCLRPAAERWFQVAVLIERSASMGMWQKLATELLRMLESAGAFGAVRGYQLTASERPALHLIHGRLGACSRPVALSQLGGPRGRTLILVVTDCVSAAWSQGHMTRFLAELAGTGPVALLHVFPPYMMERTALAEALPVWLHAPSPGATNDQLVAMPQDAYQTLPPEPRRYFKLPVLALEPQSLSAWARMLCASSAAWVSGCVLPGRAWPHDQAPAAPMDPEPPPSTHAAAAPSPVERVQAFRLSASPLARQLARLLTVFHGTGFSLPILRLLRQALLPAARPHHEAEVLLSGLLEILPESTGQTLCDPERVRYDFIPEIPALLEAMPRVLLQEPPPSGRQVLEALTGYVAQQFGSTRDFMAVVSTLSAMGQGESAFAELSHELLRRLGGSYAALASDGSAQLIKWSAAGHPQRNRVELSAYLGDPLAAALLSMMPPEEGMGIAQWLLGLRRFGSLVLSDAALCVAEDLAEHADGLEPSVRARLRGTLQCGRACLAAPSASSANAALAATQSWARESSGSARELLAQRVGVSATLAAAVPWLEEQPHGDRLRELVLVVLQGAQELLPATARRLRATISAHLRKQLFDPKSYLPPARRRNGKQILIGGDLGKISNQLRDTAAALGTLLAAAGYDLLFGGVSGVERAALRSYVAEGERSGSTSESLRLPPLVEGPTRARSLLAQLQSTDGRSGGSGDDGFSEADAIILLGETHYVDWLAGLDLGTRPLVIPLPWTGGTAQAVFKRLWDERDRYWALDGRRLGFIDSWWVPDATLQEQTQRVVHVLDVSFSLESLHKYRQFALHMLRLLVLSTERAEALLSAPRWSSYAAGLAAAAYGPEAAPAELSQAAPSRSKQAEGDVLAAHLAEVADYVTRAPSQELREATLLALASLLPAMRQWLAFDFAYIVELLDQDATVAMELVAWLVPLVIEHAWPLSRSSLLSAQFRTPARLHSLNMLLGVVRRANPSDRVYRQEVIEVATAWAQMYLQVVMPELGDTRLSLIRTWLKDSGIPAETELIERLLGDSSPEARIVGYLLLQSHDAIIPDHLAEQNLRRELQLAESRGELRPLTVLEGCRANLTAYNRDTRSRLLERGENTRNARSDRLSAPPLLHPDRGRPPRRASSASRNPESGAPATAAAADPPPRLAHFRAPEPDTGAVPDGYFSVRIGAQERVHFQASAFASLRDFLDTLYSLYLKDRFDEFSYGSSWVLVNADTDQILVSWGWLCSSDRKAYAAGANWLAMTRLGNVGLVAGSNWQVKDGEVRAYGIAVNEQVYYLVALNDKRRLLTLAAKEILVESPPEANDPRRYLYTAIFHMPDNAVLGIGDHRIFRQRKDAAS